MPATKERTHTYNAEATVLSGKLTLPVTQPIEPQAHSKLDPKGGYFSQTSDGYKLESIISFGYAYSHVAGNKSTKPGEGWNTLTTTVVEGLNVMEVLTADRVVGQTITQHPLVGYMPSISFLGTRFENLRIAGVPVEIEWDQEILPPRRPTTCLTPSIRAWSAASDASTTASSRTRTFPPSSRNITINFPVLLESRRRLNVHWSTGWLDSSLAPSPGT